MSGDFLLRQLLHKAKDLKVLDLRGSDSISAETLLHANILQVPLEETLIARSRWILLQSQAMAAIQTMR